MLIILFGLSGAGKNFVGDVFAQRFGFHFWDADKALPEVMQNQIQQNSLFTQSMRDSFTRTITDNIQVLQKTHSKLVIAQALYKEINRVQIQALFPDALFIHITAPIEVIEARLSFRPSGINKDYAEKIRQQFELPALMHITLKNESDIAAVIQQLTFAIPTLIA